MLSIMENLLILFWSFIFRHFKIVIKNPCKLIIPVSYIAI